ncbi:hypothetical protein C8F04DRAFT_1191708 [Mycena alexandri]|uniref:Transmembrane protein n=1 Tax=Mycena alexandri TaxID=1745969 RepID=A0AAD6SDA7_9AGAR|nr:hypothetical protein C8F04DRAFT_1191708 [Mycena alexandri]
MWCLASILQVPLFALFNPLVRVWSLRLFVVWTIILLGTSTYVGLMCMSSVSFYPTPFGIRLGTAVFLVLPPEVTSQRCLAIIDLVLNLLEITGVSYIIHIYSEPDLVEVFIFALDGLSLFSAPRLYPIAFIVELAGLIFLALFRIATIVKSDQKVFRQQVEFLGACSPVYPPYTPLRIFLNRSMTRPLMRGEFQPILLLRAVIIWCITLGLPAFALYTVVFKPLTPHVYTQYLSPFSDSSFHQEASGNVTLLLTTLGDYNASDVQVEFFTWDGSACDTIHDTTSRTISALQIPFGTPPILVTPVQSNLDADILTSGVGVPLFPGSHLGAVFTWTQTDIISSVTWGVSNRLTAVFTPDIVGLQPFQNPWPVGPNVATLTLVQVTSVATRHLVDAADATVLSGIATFGGFWTFLNGAFSLFFGANVLYFALGRRPLSALGIIHIFQRRRLERQWHEDFPALHTEGGLPGSESAGIVAFIRERLVNLGEDPHQPDDVEAQKNFDAGESNDGAEPTESERIPNSPTRELGSIPDDIPLLDVTSRIAGGKDAAAE